MVVSPADALNALAQFGIRRHEAADAKRQQTIERRGLDFIAATLIFDGRPVVTALAANLVEPRFVTTAMLNDGKYYTVIWTWRGEAHRIISFRRARHGEERAHRALHTR